MGANILEHDSATTRNIFETEIKEFLVASFLAALALAYDIDEHIGDSTATGDQLD